MFDWSAKGSLKMTTIQQTLDFTRVPKLVFDADIKRRYRDILTMLDATNIPLYLVGPSGSGKSVMMLNVLKNYAEKHSVPAYYVQLSPDMTKTSLVLGLRLVNGSLEPVDGVLAQAMSEGAIVGIDEATHTTQELLLMLNSIMDRTSVTSIGDKTVEAKPSFRVLFGANDSSYAGNIRLPQSFAQRLVAIPFDFPTPEGELKIAAMITRSEIGKVGVPKPVAAYLTDYVRSIRTQEYPLSARNISSAMIRLSLTVRNKGAEVDQFFSDSATSEAVRRNIANRILGADAIKSVNDLADPAINQFIQFVSEIGLDHFREIVKGSMMYFLDVDGMEINQATVKERIVSELI
jgi:MoxR-like ATPase